MGRRGRRREKKRPSGCVYGDRVDCDDVQSHECYSATNQRDCCDTCDDFRVTDHDTGCQFGDRIADCPEDKPWRCYDNKYRDDDCCFTCGNIYTSVQGCEYGDRVGNCLASECNVYSSSRRHECCGTCPPPNNPNYSTTPSSQTYTGDSDGTGQSPDWIAPVVGSIGGVLLIAILIAVFLWWRKRKGEPQNLSPIDEKMYNDYKLSKRPPMALPRDETLPEDITKKTSLTRENSAEYAYINPEEVTSFPGEIQRSETAPLPVPTPGPTEYLHLGNADKYGYLEPLGTTVKGAKSPTAPDRQDHSVQYTNQQSGPHRLNTYQKLPADKSQDVASHAYSHLQSNKM